MKLFNLLLFLFVCSISSNILMAEEVGLPQFDTSKYSQQIFWLVITFSTLYFFISLFIVPKFKKIKAHRGNIILANIEKSIKIKKDIDKINLSIENIKNQYKKQSTEAKEALVKKISELKKSKQADLEKYKNTQLSALENKKSNYYSSLNTKNDEKELLDIILGKLNIKKQ